MYIYTCLYKIHVDICVHLYIYKYICCIYIWIRQNVPSLSTHKTYQNPSSQFKNLDLISPFESQYRVLAEVTAFQEARRLGQTTHSLFKMGDIIIYIYPYPSVFRFNIIIYGISIYKYKYHPIINIKFIIWYNLSIGISHVCQVLWLKSVESPFCSWAHASAAAGGPLGQSNWVAPESCA